MEQENKNTANRHTPHSKTAETHTKKAAHRKNVDDTLGDDLDLDLGADLGNDKDDFGIEER